jgi:hypothetical protein
MLPTAPARELALETASRSVVADPRKLPARPGERVAAGLDDHPPACSAPLDHRRISSPTASLNSRC